MLVYHADWSANAGKRCAVRATRLDGRWRADEQERVGATRTLLARPRRDAATGERRAACR